MSPDEFPSSLWPLACVGLLKGEDDISHHRLIVSEELNPLSSGKEPA